MQDTTSLQTLQGELGQGNSAIPSLDLNTLMPLMVTSVVITIILTVLFLIYVSFTTIRRYKVEKATLEMQKDIRRMRELMEQGSSLPTDTYPASKDLLAAHTPTEPDGVEQPAQD